MTRLCMVSCFEKKSLSFAKNIFKIMKKELVIFFLSALTLFSCGGNRAKETFSVEEINKTISGLIQYIPDHRIDESIKPHYTEEFFTLLQKAWNVPSPEDGIGDEEFLYFFIEGNGDCYASINGTEHECKNFKTKIDGNTVVSTFDYVHGPDEIDSHTITLKKVGNSWLIDDWDDNKKAVAEFLKSNGF